MSIKIMSQVWELELDHNRLLVLLALADHADDQGRNCYPSVDYTAWKVGYSRRQIQRVLRLLEEDGLIHPIAYSAGGRATTHYEIHVERGAKKSPPAGMPRATKRTHTGDSPSNGRATSTAPTGDKTVAPEPSENHQEESSKETSGDAARRGRAAAPDWWSPMLGLPGYKDRDNSHLIQVIEDTCSHGPNPISCRWVVLAFADYYLLNHRRLGWSDAAAALRRNLSREVAKVMKLTPAERTAILDRLKHWQAPRPSPKQEAPGPMSQPDSINGKSPWTRITSMLLEWWPSNAAQWIHGTELLGVDAERAYVSVPTTRVMDYLNRRFYSDIERVTNQVLGGRRSIEFIIGEDDDGPSANGHI